MVASYVACRPKNIMLKTSPNSLKALTHGIYAINKLPRQLLCSSDVHVYGFDGGRLDAVYAPRTLRNNLL